MNASRVSRLNKPIESHLSLLAASVGTYSVDHFAHRSIVSDE